MASKPADGSKKTLFYRAVLWASRPAGCDADGAWQKTCGCVANGFQHWGYFDELRTSARFV